MLAQTMRTYESSDSCTTIQVTVMAAQEQVTSTAVLPQCWAVNALSQSRRELEFTSYG